MHFLMSNGAPATFAVDRATAEVILGEVEIQEIPFTDMSDKDWSAADRAEGRGGIDLGRGHRCFAVAC